MKFPGFQGLFKSYAAILALRVLQKAAGFAVMIVLFRTLTVENVATYNFALSVAAGLAIFALPEMKNAITQSVARGFDGTYRPAVRFAASASFLGTLVVALVALYFLLLKQAELTALALAVVAVFFPFSAGLEHWRGYLQGKSRFAKFALLEGIMALLRSGALATALYVGVTENVALLVAISFLFPALLNIVMNLRFRTLTKAAGEAEPGLIRYGLISSFFAGVAQLAQQIEKITLFALSPQAMTVFVAGERWSTILQGLVQDLASVMGPRFAKRKNFDAELDKKLRWLSIAMGAVSLAVAFLLFPYVIPLAFGDRYAESVWVAQMLSVSAVVMYHSSFRFRYVKSKKDLKNFRNVSLIGPMVRIVCAVPLISYFGINGAIASVFIGNFVINRTIYRAVQDHWK